MSGTIDKKLAGLGIELPAPVAPIANYAGFVRTGSLLFVSGQLCVHLDLPAQDLHRRRLVRDDRDLLALGWTAFGGE
jgi:enamine deaminase RidA (YjgF/YER057c/UK114 family)